MKVRTVSRPVLYVMIGFPASGKSTFFKTLKHIDVYSADAVRGEWFGDEGLQFCDAFFKERGIDVTGRSDTEKTRIANSIVWKEVYRRAEQSLSAGRDTAIDGINISRRVRKRIIRRFRKQAVIHGIWMTAGSELCVLRDAQRARNVGAEIIREMAAHFEMPEVTEGFDILELRDENGNLCRRMYGTGFRKNDAVTGGETGNSRP